MMLKDLLAFDRIKAVGGWAGRMKKQRLEAVPASARGGLRDLWPDCVVSFI